MNSKHEIGYIILTKGCSKDRTHLEWEPEVSIVH